MIKNKVLVLFSNGLDSRLACKILQEQADVTCFFTLLPFIKANLEAVKKFCKENKLKLKIVDAAKGKLLQEYLQILRSPRFGRGTALNPCIDCHIFIFKLAKKYADRNKINIIASGEVLGERPMSQHKKALETVEKEAGFEILRPLSANLLPETGAENSGLIDRNKLFGIQGRSRKKQIELAAKYKISYPTPGGGCLLCEPEFSKKLKQILKDKLSELDIELIKLGRHFENSKIILGKNQEENSKLEQIHKKYKKGLILEPVQPGPTAFVRDKSCVEKAKELIRQYSKHKIEKLKVKSLE